jgi:hypothetical protein
MLPPCHSSLTDEPSDEMGRSPRTPRPHREHRTLFSVDEAAAERGAYRCNLASSPDVQGCTWLCSAARREVDRIMERTAIEYRAESRILVLSAERLTNRADSEAQYLAASAAARMANLLERGFSVEQAQALAMGEEIQR